MSKQEYDELLAALTLLWGGPYRRPVNVLRPQIRTSR